MIRVFPANRPALIDAELHLPAGPTISVSEPGVQAQNRTYQDLLQNPTDEENFDRLVTAEIFITDLNGHRTPVLPADRYSRLSFSPNGTYLLVSRLRKPYSYQVPYTRFPTVTDIYEASGQWVCQVHEKPLIEALPKGFMATQTGKRSIGWRNDRPATLYWVEALNGGDPEVKVEHRDELFELPAPFDGSPRTLAKTIDRFSTVL
ncbi:MAG: hypothetical protein LUD68_03940 [Rikenellaceae bacterium]|nr:hypothetical protein [Rikenellaceae bacterium]